MVFKFLRNKTNGQFAGSVGVGKNKIPTISTAPNKVKNTKQPYDFSEMEIGSLRAAAESTKHFADHKRPARKNPRARWPVFGRTGFKMTQGSSHSLSHWNRKGDTKTKPSTKADLAEAELVVIGLIDPRALNPKVDTRVKAAQVEPINPTVAEFLARDS